ncbi:hypothetical protein ACZ90_49130 [Streptomyces albus subsp. albus]|nr:hypothetical protein ACZ90_49130 [Streptomyces albus subsp. albus]
MAPFGAAALGSAAPPGTVAPLGDAAPLRAVAPLACSVMSFPPGPRSPVGGVPAGGGPVVPVTSADDSSCR